MTTAVAKYKYGSSAGSRRERKTALVALLKTVTPQTNAKENTAERSSDRARTIDSSYILARRSSTRRTETDTAFHGSATVIRCPSHDQSVSLRTPRLSPAIRRRKDPGVVCFLRKDGAMRRTPVFALVVAGVLGCQGNGGPSGSFA